MNCVTLRLNSAYTKQSSGFCHYDWSKPAKSSLRFHDCTCLCLSKWKKNSAGHCVSLCWSKGPPSTASCFFEVGFLSNERVRCNFLLLCSLCACTPLHLKQICRVYVNSQDRCFPFFTTSASFLLQMHTRAHTRAH